MGRLNRGTQKLCGFHLSMCFVCGPKSILAWDLPFPMSFFKTQYSCRRIPDKTVQHMGVSCCRTLNSRNNLPESSIGLARQKMQVYKDRGWGLLGVHRFKRSPSPLTLFVPLSCSPFSFNFPTQPGPLRPLPHPSNSSFLSASSQNPCLVQLSKSHPSSYLLFSKAPQLVLHPSLYAVLSPCPD